MAGDSNQPRELVRVKSDRPGHAGYYTTYRDQMRPGEEEYFDTPPQPDPLPQPTRKKGKR